MKHDMAHEELQNQAMLRLASAVASVAAHVGSKPALDDAHAVTRMLLGEQEPEAAAAPAPEAAQAVVTVSADHGASAEAPTASDDGEVKVVTDDVAGAAKEQS